MIECIGDFVEEILFQKYCTIYSLRSDILFDL